MKRLRRYELFWLISRYGLTWTGITWDGYAEDADDAIVRALLQLPMLQTLITDSASPIVPIIRELPQEARAT